MCWGVTKKDRKSTRVIKGNLQLVELMEIVEKASM